MRSNIENHNGKNIEEKKGGKPTRVDRVTLVALMNQVKGACQRHGLAEERYGMSES